MRKDGEEGAVWGLADRIVGAAATLSTTQCPFNPTVSEPSEKLGSLGNNPGIVLIASRLEPNWIVLRTGCLLKDFSTMFTVHIVLGRQLCLYCGFVVTQWIFFSQSKSHFFHCDGLFFLCRAFFFIRGVTGLTCLWIKSKRKWSNPHFFSHFSIKDSWHACLMLV